MCIQEGSNMYIAEKVNLLNTLNKGKLALIFYNIYRLFS